MPKTESLDEVIAQRAAEFADQIRAAAVMADKEEEIRIEVEKQLAFIQKDAGVKLEGKHEFTVAQGRADSVYQRVIIEYKNPKSPGTRIGPKGESPGTKKVVDQLKKRFYDMQSELGHPLNSMFGVGLDGNYFVFVRFRDNKWQPQEPVEVNKYSAERFLWALYNLGQKGKPFSSEYLAGDFGSESPLAQDGVRILYEAIATTDHPKAQVFFNQWKILFGEVCGYDVDNPSDKIKKLAEFYRIEHRRKLRPAELLFAVHSYYAIFMKLLASEIAAYFHKLPTPLQKMIQAGSSKALKREMEDLELGSIFRHLNITNFLEGDLFAWYTSVWSESIEQLVRGMVARLDDYNPGTLSEEPASSRDLLKKLYQQLFPKSVRHDLGEYYTPDWLAEHVLNELEYIGDPDKRLLDPASGSGTFLVIAINRIRKWYDEHREETRFGEGDLCRKILANVVGFDLNPLAVMAARTNYLIAIRDLIGHVDKVEIPVYLCDSIMTPSEYGGLFAGTLGKAKELRTAAARFIIPTEIATHRDDIARYAQELEFCVANAFSPEEFLERCHEVGLPVSEDALHSTLYSELVKLDKANKNGVWARIIKNAFAPLFTGAVDYVVGNPPWINWENLPADYRDSTKTLWDRYRLRERTTGGSRLGNVKKELSALFVYVCVDHYLPVNGRLGFVITQSVFKTGANEGFRRFGWDNNSFSVEEVADMSLLQPFENAINRTAVVVVNKGKTTAYPTPYRLWVPRAGSSQPADSELTAILNDIEIHQWLASPAEPRVRESTWFTASVSVFPILKKFFGSRSAALMDRTYAGSCTWLNSVFWLERQSSGQVNRREVLVRNLADVGKKKVRAVTVAVEEDFLFPLLRGRDVHAWKARPSATIIIPHKPNNFSQPFGLTELKQIAPLTFAFLRTFEKDLRNRSGYKQVHKNRSEYYVVGNTGNYLLSPYKVVFKELTEVFQCAVVRTRMGQDASAKPVIPDHKLLFINCESLNESYFLAGLLNSIPIRCALYGASVGVQTQSYYPTDISRLNLPQFNNANSLHSEIAKISRQCHETAEKEDANMLAMLERKLSIAVSDLWQISEREQRAIQKFYDELLSLRGPRMMNLQKSERTEDTE